MAVRSVSVTAPNANRNGLLIAWTGLLLNDTGEPTEAVDFADRTVQISGTFGTGGSCTLEGSNDGSSWFALTDPQGNNITKTAAALEVIEEGPRYIRPNVTAGDGTTNLTVTLWARRGR
ncbi:MAG: hypothetical protein U1F35_05375 [Steroidobacteraceae bacterium]